MTLNGAIKQLHELRCNEDVPVYLKPAIAEVINTLLMDTQEVRHGRWEKHLVPTDFDGEVFNVEHIVCSVCESSIPLNKTYKRDWYSDYCPSCGSRMDFDEVERNEN
jgi:hypothetical protein